MGVILLSFNTSELSFIISCFTKVGDCKRDLNLATQISIFYFQPANLDIRIKVVKQKGYHYRSR
jgi:hypothetical protein